jgi:hypothetical protein
VIASAALVCLQIASGVGTRHACYASPASGEILTEAGTPTPISFASNSFASQDMLTDPIPILPAVKWITDKPEPIEDIVVAEARFEPCAKILSL